MNLGRLNTRINGVGFVNLSINQRYLLSNVALKGTAATSALPRHGSTRTALVGIYSVPFTFTHITHLESLRHLDDLNSPPR